MIPDRIRVRDPAVLAAAKPEARSGLQTVPYVSDRTCLEPGPQAGVKVPAATVRAACKLTMNGGPPAAAGPAQRGLTGASTNMQRKSDMRLLVPVMLEMYMKAIEHKA
eukprot:748210-Hanusia_phi.AAC.3